MKKIRITARAASFVNEWRSRLKRRYVPVIMWHAKISGIPNFIPNLGLAFENPMSLIVRVSWNAKEKTSRFFNTCLTSYSGKMV